LINTSEVNRVATLMLQERSDASTALAIQESMMSANLDHFDSVEVDASAVIKFDATLLQLLVAWFNLLDSHHIPWRWRGVSEAFSAAVDYAGLTQVLRLTNGESHENPFV
jgi:anti-anti-sigma regulatory factor